MGAGPTAPRMWSKQMQTATSRSWRACWLSRSSASGAGGAAGKLVLLGWQPRDWPCRGAPAAARAGRHALQSQGAGEMSDRGRLNHGRPRRTAAANRPEPPGPATQRVPHDRLQTCRSDLGKPRRTGGSRGQKARSNPEDACRHSRAVAVLTSAVIHSHIVLKFLLRRYSPASCAKRSSEAEAMGRGAAERPMPGCGRGAPTPLSRPAASP